jgi:hypothetical protein
MSESLLRSRLIRLASENPALRKDLLPLLKTAMRDPDIQAAADAVNNTMAHLLSSRDELRKALKFAQQGGASRFEIEALREMLQDLEGTNRVLQSRLNTVREDLLQYADEV